MVTNPDLYPDFFELRVTDVRVAGDRTLWLRFNDGVEGVATLPGLRGRTLARLKDPAFFSRARLAHGYTVAWPGDIDLAPEYLYRLVRPSNGTRKCDPERINDDRARRYVAQLRRVPEISRFFGIVIHMWWSEHAHPHFHARYGSYGVRVPIGDYPPATHKFPRRQLKRVVEWRDLHRAELLANWKRMRRGLDPLPIEPLRPS